MPQQRLECLPLSADINSSRPEVKKNEDQGIGTMLLQQARAWAKERNLEYIELGVLAGNEGASRLYEKMGFSDVQKTMRCRL